MITFFICIGFALVGVAIGWTARSIVCERKHDEP